MDQTFQLPQNMLPNFMTKLLLKMADSQYNWPMILGQSSKVQKIKAVIDSTWPTESDQTLRLGWVSDVVFVVY